MSMGRSQGARRWGRLLQEESESRGRRVLNSCMQLRHWCVHDQIFRVDTEE